MLISKKMTLKPLLESAEGVHLTAYLVNRGKLIDLKKQLREAIGQAQEWLNPVMTDEERAKFLEPLDTLLVDARIFKEMKGNIGIFRNQESFRVLNVPVDVEQTCQVATSFHVKPLLRWLQSDQDFLLLGLEQRAAHLYLGSQSSLKLIDSILYPESFPKGKSMVDTLSPKTARQSRLKEDETFVWLNTWIAQLTKTSKPKLFLAGTKELIEAFNRSLKYKNSVKAPVANFFNTNNVSDVSSSIRKILKADSKAAIEKTLMEFRFADEGKRTQKNIFQISKAIVQGRVRKLIVTDEISIFGKIDRKSGGLAIHPFDLDHEDDDILDDLAQMVLSQGGEVTVASRSEIPNGRPILAILDDDHKELARAEDSYQYEVLQERFG
ncbi:MAG: hypothetical protein JNM39_13200 [Bdellovibrionaceae bacterium]|nr:hypothetical protein [Pseudobdellovibrionaceae bacterium]